jgi:hypothetical protein
MADSGQTSVTVPSTLWRRVTKLPLGDLGYGSPTEVVKEAIREKCESLEVRSRRGKA